MQSTRAVLYLSDWSELNLIRAEDIDRVSSLPEVQGEQEAFEDG